VAVPSTTRSRARTVDAQCAGAVDIARSVALEVAGSAHVGDHLGVTADDDRVVTHYFDCLSRGYRGWRWAVTVARASRSKTVTVDEVVLLPGPDALLAPPWLPWSDRLRPGDLRPGDLLPTRADDERLEPGYTGADEEPTEFAQRAPVAHELGLGRPRVLSRHGAVLAAERWYSGDGGPDTPMAKAAPARCSTCGFFVSLRGVLAHGFGVCANEYSPSDGRVVSLDHGCGAHSEAAVLPSPPESGPRSVDEFG
jgi:Protein of unknown function (DUF3027)